MWRSRNTRDGTTVVCIACGTSLPRSEAREYDKHGNRWERHGKSFEHLCKECYRGLCHQPRGELEALLIDVEETVAVDAERTPALDSESDSERTSTLDTEAEPEGTSPADSETEVGREPGPQTAFLSEYVRTVEERYGSPGESESERDS
ncbi:hypothetical protein SAMN04488133_1147 [Halobellus limi]|uniref:Small CPxCG-related zinc finger protein n=1 Tax=Halobellus limi TaxID=699433 RepID=A0A1H5W300_9EURY|nr:hypothetical protein SAMN04488133_1147 [Halobellus limi]